jgi:pilus assembly protein CpaB
MNKRILMISLAVVLALGGTVAVYAYMKNANHQTTTGQAAATVVIADKAIPAGTSWDSASTDGYLRTEHMPENVVPADAVSSLAEQIAAHDVVSADIPAGQIILRQMFAKTAPATSGLQIPGKDMAVSVKLNVEDDVAGYVQPGSEVAIFDTFIMLGKGTPAGTATGAEKTDNWATKLLLPRVQVLAVSQAAPSTTHSDLSSDSGSASQSTTLLVTVAVPQASAERLIQVASSGNLYLALLTSHSASAPAPGVDNRRLLGPVFAK